jgi:predicted ATP-dependent endonuclease of OLD family
VASYRTIKKLETNFNQGLNIIIGDNGSGKTNFLKLLSSIMSFSKTKLAYTSDFKCEISFYEDIVLSIKNSPQAISKDTDIDAQGDDLNYYLVDKEKSIPIQRKKDLNEYFEKHNQHSYVLIIIGHGMPGRPMLFLTEPFNGAIKINLEDDIHEQLFSLVSENLDRYFQVPFSNFLRFELVVATDKLEELKEKWEAVISGTCKYFTNIFKRCTQVSDVRVSPSFSIEWNSTTNDLAVKNLFFEFYQNDRWNVFSELSDGTKRIISILMSVVEYDSFVLSKNEFKEVVSVKRHKIVIVEEPELGINPHQLYKLMLVLKEEAKTKQIIITTHSPVTLDVLEKHELESILVCTYNSKEGTLISPLTSKEREKAAKYIEEVGYLSTYWSHSELQRN